MDGPRVLRAMTPEAFAEWSAVAATPFCRAGMEAGRIVRTGVAEFDPGQLPAPEFTAALEHERIPLIAWPYEWSYSMLQDAALLTLNLMRDALQDDCILKDGTPYNVQFRGASPVFIDAGSIERLQAGQAWAGYRQFCQLFLFPLMLQSWKGVDFQPWLRGALEGIAPTAMAGLLSWRDLFRRGALTHVWLHARLQRSPARVSATANVQQSMQASGFHRDMIRSNVRGLRKLIERLSWGATASVWSDYDAASEPVQRDAVDKESFVERVCATRRRSTVWDLGCNLGRYSRIAARHADLVVAMDADHLTIDRLYQSLRRESAQTIVPLVMNVADPSPSLGWRGQERANLLSRSKPDLVLCLALIHHLVIGSNLLLDDVIDWLASLGCEVFIEFVDRSDRQVQVLLANRRDVFTDYSESAFRTAVTRRFRIEQEQRLTSGTRTLFLLSPATLSGQASPSGVVS